MAVHFEFTLDDVDAENVFNILHKHVTHSRFEVQLEDVTQAEKDWHKGHADYFEGVISKMLVGNYHVEDVEDVEDVEEGAKDGKS